VSISPWYFTKLEQKYKDGLPTRIGPDYYSAVVDWLFFDIDVKQKDGTINEAAIRTRDLLALWSRRHSYKREFTFTGGGYQFFIGCSLGANIYQPVMASLFQEFGLAVDELVLLQQMRRIPGSFNFGKDSKSERWLFCIDLKEDEVLLPFDEHVNLARKQRKERYIYGSELYKPSGNFKERCKPRSFIIGQHPTDASLEDIDTILRRYGYRYEDICSHMRAIIEQKTVGHYERLIVIKYLKDIVLMSYEDCVALLPKILTAPHEQSNDGWHSIEECQPQSVYGGKSGFNPCWMKENGYCPSTCTECETYINGMKRL